MDKLVKRRAEANVFEKPPLNRRSAKMNLFASIVEEKEPVKTSCEIAFEKTIVSMQGIFRAYESMSPISKLRVAGRARPPVHQISEKQIDKKEDLQLFFYEQQSEINNHSFGSMRKAAPDHKSIPEEPLSGVTCR